MRIRSLKRLTAIIVLLISCMVVAGCTSIIPTDNLAGINKSDYTHVYIDKGSGTVADMPILSWELRGDMLLIESETTRFLVPRERAILYGRKK